MARLKAYSVLQTKSGLFIRKDPGLGLLVFSPYSGLIFACKESDTIPVVNWLDKKTQNPPTHEYLKSLGIDWAISTEEAKYPKEHLLPNSDRWSVPNAQKPILINWLITGNCPLECKYCYAEDLMRGKRKEPNESEICRIAKSILSYNPLVVVLTGGDPLVSLHLNLAIQLLYKKTGLILDTCGYTFADKHLKLFKKYGVFVRISLDSEIPRRNDKLRPVGQKRTNHNQKILSTTESAVSALNKCIRGHIPFAVQTVSTTLNRSDIPSLGDKLYRMGAKYWRILVVTPTGSNKEYYKQLIGDKRGQRRFWDIILKQVRSYYGNNGNRDMPVEVTPNSHPNAVILVAPDGVFCTEYKEKVLLDDKVPKKPRLSVMFDKANRQTHAERYLNLFSDKL
jgi:MoaA/NifB/PqqE/SkfB family radical SAM enzyme